MHEEEGGATGRCPKGLPSSDFRGRGRGILFSRNPLATASVGAWQRTVLPVACPMPFQHPSEAQSAAGLPVGSEVSPHRGRALGGAVHQVPCGSLVTDRFARSVLEPFIKQCFLQTRGWLLGSPLVAPCSRPGSLPPATQFQNTCCDPPPRTPQGSPSPGNATGLGLRQEARPSWSWQPGSVAG